MKIRPWPVWPPLAIMAIVLLGALLGAVVNDAALRGPYEVAKDWQTFIAAMIALAAALWAARPVYRQMQVQSAQAALDLLGRIENEIDVRTSERQAAFEVYSAAAGLAGELRSFADGRGHADALQRLVSHFQHLSAPRLKEVAARATMAPTDRVRFAKLCDELAERQKEIYEFLAVVRASDGYTVENVSQAHSALSQKLQQLAFASGQLTSEASLEETEFRVRARQLRDIADDLGG